MSNFGKQGVRCDFCGKISNRIDGTYRRPNGQAGYIGRIGEYRFPDGSKIVDERDICNECTCPYDGLPTAPDC